MKDLNSICCSLPSCFVFFFFKTYDGRGYTYPLGRAGRRPRKCTVVVGCVRQCTWFGFGVGLKEKWWLLWFGVDEEVVVVAVVGALTPVFVLNQGSRRDSGQLEEGNDLVIIYKKSQSV